MQIDVNYINQYFKVCGRKTEVKRSFQQRSQEILEPDKHIQPAAK